MTPWEGRRVLVTGASSGIGAAMARELASVGAVVGMCARRTEMLQQTLVDCQRSVAGCRAWTVDLSQLEALEAFAHRAEQELGGIDVLINNAAQTMSGRAVSTPLEDVDQLMTINYLSPVRLTLAVLPSMLEQGSGSIVAISSMAARMSTPGEAAYAATKAALSAYFEALAGEYWGTDISFHLVYPALVDLTPGLDGDDALAHDSNGSEPIPAPILAREVRRQLERGDLELYVPHAMRRQVAKRAEDVASSVRFMAEWYRSETLH